MVGSLMALSVVVYIGWRVWEAAGYYKIKERLNIVVYSQRFYLYSIDLRTDLDYLIALPLEYKADIPGGYGEYLLGSLGKLAVLEKDLDLIKRATGRIFAVPVDLLFFKDLGRVYQKPPEDNEKILQPREVFLYSSDADLADRIYLFLKLLDAGKRKVKKISVYRFVEDGRLNIQKVNEYTDGLFLSSALREENRLVQIYSSYPSAGENLMDLLEGVGINVFEVSSKASDEPCQIVEYSDSASKTGIFLQGFLKCRYDVESRKSNSIVNINIYLNKKSEEWR